MKSTCDLHRSLVYVYLDWNLNTALKKKKSVCKYCKCRTAKFCKFVCDSVSNRIVDILLS